jgi:hypothetical protein
VILIGESIEHCGAGDGHGGGSGPPAVPGVQTVDGPVSVNPLVQWMVGLHVDELVHEFDDVVLLSRSNWVTSQLVALL